MKDYDAWREAVRAAFPCALDLSQAGTKILQPGVIKSAGQTNQLLLKCLYSTQQEEGSANWGDAE
jgi:hypothetical protein